MRNFRPFLLIILASLAAHLCTSLLFGWIVIGHDTPSYLAAIDSLKAGHIDMLRTPGYPLLIWLSRSIGGTSHPYTALVILQHLLFFISLWFFWRLANWLLISFKAAYITTFIYACLPAVFTWNSKVYTESLSISLTIILLYHLLRFDQDGKIRYVLLSALITFILLIMRPAALYLLPLMAIWFTVGFFKGRKLAAIIGFAGIAAMLAIVLLYIGAFKRQFGPPLITSVTTVNQYVLLREMKLITAAPQEHYDDEVEAHVQSMLKPEPYDFWLAFMEASRLLNWFGPDTMHNYVSDIIRRNKSTYRLQFPTLFLRSTSSSLFLLHSGVVSREQGAAWRMLLRKACAYITLWIRIDLLWLVCGLSALLLFIQRHQLTNQLRGVALLLLNTLGNYAVTVLGAYHGAYDRLLAPSYASFILLTAFLVYTLRRPPSRPFVYHHTLS